MLDNGMRRGVAKIARQLNIGEATVYRILATTKSKRRR
ncbi:MAG: helix-turn-helix domain-containing protein [Methylobacter sp.]